MTNNDMTDFRVVALDAAMQYYGNKAPDDVVAAARQFEDYLSGMTDRNAALRRDLEQATVEMRRERDRFIGLCDEIEAGRKAAEPLKTQAVTDPGNLMSNATGIKWRVATDKPS